MEQEEVGDGDVHAEVVLRIRVQVEPVRHRVLEVDPLLHKRWQLVHLQIETGTESVTLGFIFLILK